MGLKACDINFELISHDSIPLMHVHVGNYMYNSIALSLSLLINLPLFPTFFAPLPGIHKQLVPDTPAIMSSWVLRE